MGFLTGSATFERFRIIEDPTGVFGEEHLELLKQHKIKSSGGNLFEKQRVGFSGGAHVLDTKFDFEKNIIGEAMHFGIRIDSCQIPGPIKQAWMKIELAGIMKDAQGRPSKAQRDEAKEAVEAKCVAESENGNYKKMAVTPVLWDSVAGTLYLGGTSEKTNDTCLEFLSETFGLELSRVTSGKLALEFGEATDQTAAVFDATPASLHPETGGAVVWWNGMKDNYDFLGNEFLLWLWWNWEHNGGTMELSDGSEVAGMFARTLSLDCARGENGKESISSDSPVALPEAMLATRMGKLPRKAGLTLIRDDEQFDFSLKAETFSVGAARIRAIGKDPETPDQLERIESVRQLSETIDLLFNLFCEARFGKAWGSQLKKIQSWLTSDQTGQSRKRSAA